MDTILRPEWLLAKGALHTGWEVRVEAGRIASVGPAHGPVDLPDRLLMAGFVNAHSHAFQRGIRGLVQWSDGIDDFWSWRERMYGLANVLDPEGVEVYRGNGEQYRARLDSLHQWVIEQVGEIPEQQRVLITAHDAFGYFGLAYGFEVVGLQGISTVAEYGVNDVTQLVDRIVERQVKAIFVESSVPARSIEAVRQGCLNRGFEVVIGGTLYSDAMGGAGSGADSYVGMVESNVNTIVGALR